MYEKKMKSFLDLKNEVSLPATNWEGKVEDRYLGSNTQVIIVSTDTVPTLTTSAAVTSPAQRVSDSETPNFSRTKKELNDLP